MNLTDVKSKEIMPGFHGKVIHGETVTWVYWNIEKGSSLSEHHHVHEQIMHVLEGEFEFILNGKKNLMGRRKCIWKKRISRMRMH